MARLTLLLVAVLAAMATAFVPASTPLSRSGEFSGDDGEIVITTVAMAVAPWSGTAGRFDVAFFPGSHDGPLRQGASGDSSTQQIDMVVEINHQYLQS
ncbi:hypothetical protein ACHAWF_004085 [Thalassiosira exigua]